MDPLINTGKSLGRAAALLFFALLMFGIADLPAQTVLRLPPNRGGMTTAMGLPPTWRFSLGAQAATHRRNEEQLAFYFNATAYRDLITPTFSALGLLSEGYIGPRSDRARPKPGLDGGFRLSLYSPVLRLAGGVDYNIPDGQGDFMLSLIHPFKRGGIFTNGGSLRIDWLPGRGHSTSIGLSFPVGQRWVGTGRPRNDHVVLPVREPPPISIQPSESDRNAIDNARTLAVAVNRFVVPFTDQWDGDKDEADSLFVEEIEGIRAYMESDADPFYQGTRTVVGDVNAFHGELDRAFSQATSGRAFDVGEASELGRQVAEKAREIVLEDVLLPYNALLGQKRRKDTTTGLGAAASSAFYEWLTTEAPVSRERATRTVWVFAQYLEIVEHIREVNLEQWDDGRFVWLPLQLALLPHQHDEQAELNRLVERATATPFVEGSSVWYVENDQFQAELKRMILETRNYHVLWVHDFRGYDDEGNIDEVSFRQVTEGYLPALINAVRRYDETGIIPQYLLIFDQFYFQSNYGRLWTEVLERPMEHKIDLPFGYEEWEDSIASLQGQLREAVEGSLLMQAQAAHFGEEWVENLVRVQVSITHPPDPSFWSDEIFPFPMGLTDIVARDHRKIAFFDVSEADPYAGRAIYTGMGIGEHYIGAGWEDRAIMVQGPVLLQLRESARTLLQNQGFSDQEIPWELLPKEYGADYDDRIAQHQAEVGDWELGLQVHNQVGYRPKNVSVLKAVLYTLMPPGAVIKAPDSVWGSQLWGSMMLGHALRGGRSLVIAPAIANAPSAGFPQMSRAQEVLTRLVVANQVLSDQLAENDGQLRVGLYRTDLDARDIPGKISALLDRLDDTPWLRELYGFDPAVLTGLAEEVQELRDAGLGYSYPAGQERPSPELHMKGHVYITRPAWEGMMTNPAMEGLLRAHFEQLATAKNALALGEDSDLREYSDRLGPFANAVVQPVVESVPPSEVGSLALFMAVGSHNQNNRSFALDGEVAFLTAGWGTLTGLMDFITLTGLSEWVDDVEELEALLPGYDGLKRWLSRFIRIAV